MCETQIYHTNSFFLWRLLKKGVFTDDVLKRMGIPIVSRYWCCECVVEETLDHLFLTASIAENLWRLFAYCAGFTIKSHSLLSNIFRWWRMVDGLRGKRVLHVLPAIIVWELWKSRNNIKHEKSSSLDKLIQNCNKILHALIKMSFPQLKNVPTGWELALTFYKVRDQFYNIG